MMQNMQGILNGVTNQITTDGEQTRALLTNGVNALGDYNIQQTAMLTDQIGTQNAMLSDQVGTQNAMISDQIGTQNAMITDQMNRGFVAITDGMQVNQQQLMNFINDVRSQNYRQLTDEHFCADGWNPNIITFLVFAAIIDLNIVVDVGFVTGVTPAIIPTGSAIST